MCHTVFWRSRTCSHTWLTLRSPCTKHANLLTCPDFQQGQIFGPAPMWPIPWRMADDGECPRCFTEGDYNRRYVRMIRVKRAGFKIGGTGPYREDGGVECGCCFM